MLFGIPLTRGWTPGLFPQGLRSGKGWPIGVPRVSVVATLWYSLKREREDGRMTMFSQRGLFLALPRGNDHGRSVGTSHGKTPLNVSRDAPLHVRCKYKEGFPMTALTWQNPPASPDLKSRTGQNGRSRKKKPRCAHMGAISSENRRFRPFSEGKPSEKGAETHFLCAKGTDMLYNLSKPDS